MPAGPVRYTGQLPACYANDFRAGGSLLTAGSNRTGTIPKISIFADGIYPSPHDLEETECLPMSPLWLAGPRKTQCLPVSQTPNWPYLGKTQCLPMSRPRTGRTSENSIFINVTAPNWQDLAKLNVYQCHRPNWASPSETKSISMFRKPKTETASAPAIRQAGLELSILRRYTLICQNSLSGLCSSPGLEVYDQAELNWNSRFN